MLYKLWLILRGGLIAFLLLFNLLFFSSVTVLFAVVAWLIPKSPLKTKATHVAFIPPIWWTYCNKAALMMCSYGKWDIKGEGLLNPKGSYVVIANHESWLDIPVLGSIFNRKIPLLKFFMKKELLWQLPIAGLACHLLGYPMMARYSRSEIRKKPELRNRDLITTQKAYKKFKKHPTTFIIFAEGTRFTDKKHEKTASPYKNLLKPKTAGLALIMNEMSDQLTAVVDATLHYDTQHKSLWHFLCGKTNRIFIRYQVINPSELLIKDAESDRDYRKRLQLWINTIWESKDQQIESFKRPKT